VSCRLAAARVEPLKCTACTTLGKPSSHAFLVGLAMGSAGSDLLMVELCERCELALVAVIAKHNGNRETS